MRRLLLAVSAAVLSVVLLAPPAVADEVQGTDPANDVPFDRGDIVFFRAIHGSAKVDLRVRTELGGQPVNVWPNTATRIRWRIDVGAPAGPEYFADLVIQRGEDTVLRGKVRRVSDNQLRCTADQFVTGDNEVFANQSTYRFRFLRGCIGAPVTFRARATFIWDNGAAGVGPVHTDYAPNSGPTGPIASG